MAHILIVGANSDIGKAVALEYGKNGYDLYLAARDINRLDEFANDIKVRFERDVKCVELDILNCLSHKNFYETVTDKLVGVITVVGYLGEQLKAQDNFTEAQTIINTNYTGIVSLLEIIAGDFEKRKSGFIVGISSVAGDRGRQSNYIYGSAKAAFSAYLSGLRNRLFTSNVHVMTVKPGFVNTKMTEGMDLPKLITAQPNEIAKDIFKAQRNKKNSIYTKKRWALIMLIVKFIPEFLFKKLSL